MSPLILEVLLSGLQAWYQEEPTLMVSQYVTQLLMDQLAIGWEGPIELWLTQSWHFE